VNSPLGCAWDPLVAEAFLDNSSVNALLKQIRGFVVVADHRLDPCNRDGHLDHGSSAREVTGELEVGRRIKEGFHDP
jgi:hypothetical protein